MKILIITLFVFATNFVSSSVLANVLEQKSVPQTEIQQEGLRALNCKKNSKENNGKEDCDWFQRQTVKNACKIYPQLCAVRGKIDLYNPNYMMYSSSNHNDGALEIQYSGRYNIKTISCVMDYKKELYINYECVEKSGITKKDIPTQYEIFLSLTGRYDFYAFSDEDTINRKSRPVINRFFNPAVHARIIGSKKTDLEFVDFSIEHLSNGQSGDLVKMDFIAREGNKNYAASDSNSISMFFPSITAQWSTSKEDSVKYKFFARAILDYWLAEVDIYSEDGVKIGEDEFPDYHRFKIGTILEIDDKWLLELSATGHKKTSFDAFLSFPVNRIPVVSLLIDNLVFRYHNGYLSRLSNYDLKEQTFGIGIGVAF